MTILYLTLRAGNIPAMLEESQQQVGACFQVKGDEITWTLQQPFGHWLSRGIQVREGLDLLFTRAEPQERVTFIENIENFSTWGIRFCLSGYSRIRPQSGADEILACPGTSLIGFMDGEMQATTDYTPHQLVETLTIGIKPELFQSLAPETHKDFQGDPHGGIQTAMPKTVITINQTTPAMATVIYRILNCPYYGDLKRLYLESKVLELIVLKLEQCRQEKAQSQSGFRLKADDLERIYRARDILVQDLEQPPSLLELAQQAEMNDFKLKRGFRHVFGTTVFGYLHQCRMEKAQQLLETNADSIAQVAQTVGYASPSQFSAAFKRKFGISPKAYKSS